MAGYNDSEGPYTGGAAGFFTHLTHITDITNKFDKDATPANGQVLTWDSTTGVYVPSSGVAGIESFTTFYGADPTGGNTDNSQPLFNMMLAALNKRCAIGLLPMGTYRLLTTFNPNDQTEDPVPLGKLVRGFTFFGGFGKIGYPPTGGDKWYGAPEFVWYGSTGGTMWEFDSIVGMAIIGVAFRGEATTSSGNRAGIGLNVSSRNLGLPGSGTHLLDRCSFVDMAVGVKMGEGQITGAGNCDTTTFRDVTFHKVDTCLYLSHQQNLVYNFDGTSSFLETKTIVRSDVGGYLCINDLNVNAGGGTGSTDWLFDLAGGSNVGTHRVLRARVENNTKQIAKLSGQHVELQLDDFIEAQSNQSVTMFDLTGGQLTMSGGKLITRDTTFTNPTFKLQNHTASGTAPTVRLYGVRLDTTSFNYREWFTHTAGTFPRIVMRDCELQHGERIPSFSTRLEDRLPVPLQATTTAATTVGSTLMNNGQTGRTDNCCAIPKGMMRIRVTIMAGLQVSSQITAIRLRATREIDVHNDGTTLTMSTPDVIGTDYNPTSLVFTLTAQNTFKNIYVACTGQASTNLYWQANFELLGEFWNGGL